MNLFVIIKIIFKMTLKIKNVLVKQCYKTYFSSCIEFGLILILHLAFFFYLSLYLIETPYDTFANRVDVIQTALVRGCLIRIYSVCLLKYDISDPTLVDPPRNFFNLCANMIIFLYIHS